MTNTEAEAWRTAALLKDRTRRAIRARRRAGEPAVSIADDHGVPVAFVEQLGPWQLFEDPQPTEGETWNTCPDCGAHWKDYPATPGVVHRTRVCVSCGGARA